MTKDPEDDETLQSFSIFMIHHEPLSIFEGLWDQWKNNGFAVFYTDVRQEIEKFLYDPYYSNKNLLYPFISKFVSFINEYYDVDKAFLAAGGLQTRYGICWIRLQIQTYYNQHGHLPTSAALPFLSTHLQTRDFEKYGYSSWERLIVQNLTEPSPKDRLKIVFGDWKEL